MNVSGVCVDKSLTQTEVYRGPKVGACKEVFLRPTVRRILYYGGDCSGYLLRRLTAKKKKKRGRRFCCFFARCIYF